MKKIYGILIMLIFIFIFSAESVSAGYNGKGNNAMYTTITECKPEWNGYCQFDNDNHKTIKMTLYYFDSKNKRTKIGESVYYSEITKWYGQNPAKLRIPLEDANIDKDRNATIGTYFSFEELYKSYYGNTNNYSYEKFNSYTKISSNLKQYVAKKEFLDYLIKKITSNNYNSTTLKTKEGEYRIIIEPVVTLVRKNYYYAFTVKYLAEQGYDNITNPVHWTNSGNSRKFPMMLYTSYDDVGIKATKCNDVTAKNISSKVASVTSGCGYNIIDIDPYITIPIKCQIGINNNKNSKYNWLVFDSTSQQMVPISGGCCSTYSKYGITESQVKQNYPQCFDSPCTEQINTNVTQCNNNSKGVASKKQILTANYCYAGRKYYTGVIDSNNLIFYGCTYSDSLSLPQGYKNNLTLGSNFIWPTNKELLNESPVDLDYEITRTSTATCYAYKVDKSTGYTMAYNVSNLNFDNIKNKIKEKVNFEKVKIEQNSIETGNLEGKIDSVDVIINENSAGLFDIRVNSSYNQILDVEQNSYSYRYFDNTNNKYLRYTDIKDKTKIKNYDIFSTMIMPVDNKFNVKNNYQYGLSYSTSFGSVKMSGAYNCTQKVTVDPPSCICPEGTENAGLDLSNYSKSNAGTNAKCSVSSDSECAILQDEYCNSRNISYKCPNIDYDLTECINQKKNANSKKTKVKAYNECVYEKCSCTSDDCDYKKICNSSEEDRTIYRTIFLDNPFVSDSGSIRIPGSNWGGKSSIDSSGKYTGLVQKYIIDTGKYMYDKEPMYSINLTPKAISKVKEYNNLNAYDYFNLECDDTNGRCYSVFLHKNITEYVSGTCGNIDNKNEFFKQFYSCREDSFKQ